MFKKFVYIGLILILSGCSGSNLKGTAVIQNANLETGVYYLYTGNHMLAGVLAITVDYQGRIDVEQVEELISENENNTFASHPPVNFSNALNNSNLVYYAADINYTNQYNITNSSNDRLSQDKHYTTYQLTTEGNMIKLTIMIYKKEWSNGVGKLFTERKFYAIPSKL